MSVQLNRLMAIDLDAEDAEFPFSARLARDNGWSRDYAARVIREYKRFVWLAMTAGHEVTPSDGVDQAWHLHLTYTRHYWGPFTEVLGAPLHHGPTAGGQSERRRYADNYAATLASYERVYGEAPPVDIWPAAAIRFGEAPFMQRVNKARAFVIPKKYVGRAVAGATALAGLGWLGGAQAFAQGGDVIADALSHERAPIAIGVVLVVILLVVLLSRISSAGGRKSGSGCGAGGTGCGGKSDGGGDSGCGGGCGGCGG